MIKQLFQIVGEDQRGLFRRFVALVILFCIAQGVSFLLLLPILNAIFDPGSSDLWIWIVCLVFSAGIAIICNYFSSVIGVHLSLGISSRLYHRIGDHIATLPLGWFSQQRTGTVTRTISSGTDNVVLVFGFLMTPMLNGIITPSVLTLGMLIIDWRIGIAFLVAIPFLWGMNRLGRLFYRKGDGGMDRAAAAANARIIEYVQAQPVLRAYGYVGDANQSLQKVLLQQRHASNRHLKSTIPGSIIFRIAVQLVLLLVVIAIVPLALGAQISPATAIALIAVVAQFTSSVSTVADLGGGIRMARSSLRKIADILNAKPLPVPDKPARPSSQYEVRLEGASFGYDSHSPVIQNVSFSVPSKTTVAIVGPSGSGKSTLIKLIARFYDVDSGRIDFADSDIRELATEDLMQHISLVFQDVYLFDDTIWENIRIGNEQATDEQVLRASRIAQVEEIIRRLPAGWDTNVGEGGHSLSGGERQRISIARAILKNAPVILLDEATSAIDPENEAAFLEGLAEVTTDKTVLMVAHRLSTIQGADQIVFLREGTVTEIGSHDELLKLNGDYAAFWRERAKASSWSIT
ncbi:ABC transporter ATP-binding protein [Oceanobacillus sojae]|nr:ABC transporter ATP-binding protein [Oceanobacillus sojae]